jgi:hypothetical protein
VAAQLHPLLEALTTVTNPATVVSWLADWATYVGQRATDDREDADGRKPAKQTI